MLIFLILNRNIFASKNICQFAFHMYKSFFKKFLSQCDIHSSHHEEQYTVHLGLGFFFFLFLLYYLLKNIYPNIMTDKQLFSLMENLHLFSLTWWAGWYIGILSKAIPKWGTATFKSWRFITAWSDLYTMAQKHKMTVLPLYLDFMLFL